MRFLVMVKPSPEHAKDYEAGKMPKREELAPMGAFNDALERDGMLIEATGLKPTSKGTRMNFAAETPVVSDGPFAETKELVAGFWILEARSKDELVERMRRAPFPRGEQIEIRPFTEPEDFE
ncbi:MAG TPA: YciI family protein [Candidatus Aquilonibacter sp.]|nr:YciI family protein [Candidatus Aquilonibacter sp.]